MKIYNSLTQNLDEFTSINPKKVTIYVCGITPYDTTHLGHAFTYISFDALIRYLKFQGFKVTYTQNVTDINDRDKDTLQRAKEQNIPWQNLAKYWTDKFLSDMKALDWIKPTNYLFASREIPSMIKLIQQIIDNNLAYIVNGSVYLDILKIKDFDKLSKLSKEEMLQKAKDFEEDLENPDKKTPLDITLWKASGANQPTHIPSFDSPFGKGRPGWHIECSAMSISTLGEQIDIHGGGKDLIFPHHEAEIAQSEGATNKIPFAKYWIHTGTVYYQGEKMSKSKGNLIMVSELFKKYSPNAIRWLILSNNWRKDWEYKEEDLIKAQKIVNLIEYLSFHLRGGGTKKDTLEQFTQIMNKDLDTPKALDLLIFLIDKKQLSAAKKIYLTLGFKNY